MVPCYAELSDVMENTHAGEILAEARSSGIAGRSQKHSDVSVQDDPRERRTATLFGATGRESVSIDSC